MDDIIHFFKNINMLIPGFVLGFISGLIPAVIYAKIKIESEIGKTKEEYVKYMNELKELEEKVVVVEDSIEKNEKFLLEIQRELKLHL